MTRVVIIGAGIGGLAAALALRKSGLDVVVLEQADRLQAVGTGIQLSPNANHVLARLGVLDAIIDVAFEPRSLDIVDGQRGRTLLSAPPGQRARTRYGQPYLNVHRGDLQTVLLDVVNATIPTAVELDCHVTSVVQGDDGVTVGLHDGRTVRADMVIAHGARRHGHRRRRRPFGGTPTRRHRNAASRMGRTYIQKSGAKMNDHRVLCLPVLTWKP